MNALDHDVAIRHLLLRLRPINRYLRVAVARQAAAAARLDRPDLAAVCITDQQVVDLMGDVDRLIEPAGLTDSEAGAALSAQELALEARLRATARSQDKPLPLDRLAECIGLTAFEQEVILICAAAELDHAYERIFAYILDDLKRLYPSVELVCSLSARTIGERLKRLRVVGRFGRLRQCGLVESFGEVTTELRTSLRLGQGLLDFLCGSSPDSLSLWIDQAVVSTEGEPAWLAERESSQVARLAHDVSTRAIGVVGLWARPSSRAEDAAIALARSAGLSLRRYALPPASTDPSSGIRDAIHAATAQGAALLVPVDRLGEAEHYREAAALAEALARSAVPCVLAGSEPWRPTPLLALRAFAEIEFSASSYPDRRALWREALPDADTGQVDDIAGRFRMSRQEVLAVARLARNQARLASNGIAVSITDRLDSACAAVARKAGGRFLSLVKPRRGPADLILAPDLHCQVLEIARFNRVMPCVAEAWGFARLATGGSGLKTLFTGDPGTGKTLAAEVVAGVLGVPLLKINIGQTVSKWIGETEKNLDLAFAEAESSHAVLFIDEADALCGRRGEVRHASDRYANTEVAHLLQLLEDHDGLAIFATNLKENLDAAFLRRFHAVIHFPRPPECDRLRLWNLAFPPEAPLDSRVDRSALARLDMTGAGIVGAARTAALLAADQKAPRISMSHILQGVLRQYRREGRVLTPSELGPYAGLLRET
jgi:hypothetical protein